MICRGAQTLRIQASVELCAVGLTTAREEVDGYQLFYRQKCAHRL